MMGVKYRVSSGCMKSRDRGFAQNLEYPLTFEFSASGFILLSLPSVQVSPTVVLLLRRLTLNFYFQLLRKAGFGSGMGWENRVIRDQVVYLFVAGFCFLEDHSLQSRHQQNITWIFVHCRGSTPSGYETQVFKARRSYGAHAHIRSELAHTRMLTHHHTHALTCSLLSAVSSKTCRTTPLSLSLSLSLSLLSSFFFQLTHILSTHSISIRNKNCIVCLKSSL